MNTHNVDYVAIAAARVAEQYPIIAYGVPPYWTLPSGAIWGTWAVSVPGLVRFIKAKELEIARGVLPGDVARAWTRYNYTLPIKRRRDQKRKYILPIMALPGEYPDCVYIDIRRAYYHILELFGYDVDYKLGKYLIAHPIRLPQVMRDHKWVYALVIAMSARSYTRMRAKKKDGDTYVRQSINIFSNPCLYAAASETLACIAYEIITHCQAVYFNTDGAIIPRYRLSLATRILEDWTFQCQVKGEGQTVIWGVGAWKIGDKCTRRKMSARGLHSSELPSRDAVRWLKQRLTWWNARATLQVD